MLLAFVVTAGTYAYTYSISSTTEFGVTQAGGGIATWEPASWEPDWYSVLAGLSEEDDDDDGKKGKKGKIRGAVPTGDLFVVTTHPNYTGDLLLKVYVTNTGDLVKAYRYLNMKVYLDGSIETEQEPGYQLLTLDNGVANFNLKGNAGGGSRTVTIIGGSYGLISHKLNKWQDGWTVVPEFYCEVGPR
jgi:hypothetical protein